MFSQIAALGSTAYWCGRILAGGTSVTGDTDRDLHCRRDTVAGAIYVALFGCQYFEEKKRPISELIGRAT